MVIGWRDSRLVEDSQDAPMEKALVIENRYRARGFILPREHIRDDDMSQNTRDASRLRHWRRSAEVGKAADGVPEALMVGAPGYMFDAGVQAYTLLH